MREYEIRHAHSGEAAAAAYLALGHAYLLDKRFGEAEANLVEARKAGDILADYADFLGAQSNHEAGNDATAEALLHGFAARYPDSIFNAQAPELEANVLLALNNSSGAQQCWRRIRALPAARLPARSGASRPQAQSERRGRAHLQTCVARPPLELRCADRPRQAHLHGAEATLTTAELRSLGDAYYNANRFEEAAEQYRALMRNSTLDATPATGSP